jgi:hypothetical protein
MLALESKTRPRKAGSPKVAAQVLKALFPNGPRERMWADVGRKQGELGYNQLLFPLVTVPICSHVFVFSSAQLWRSDAVRGNEIRLMNWRGLLTTHKPQKQFTTKTTETTKHLRA